MNQEIAISGVTNVLVTGEDPGKRKVVKAHERQVKIITIKQMNGFILGNFTLEDLTTDDYPEVAITVLDAEKIRVQHHPQSSVQHEQAQDGTARISILGQEDDAVSAGAGHSNG